MRKKKKEIIDSFIGRDAAFEGRLSFSGTVRIDGSFQGEIDATGNLVLGSEGKIEGDINTGSVISSGEIHGKVIAEESIELRVPGKMFGDIQAPKVVIRPGVVFEGSCRMGSNDDKVQSLEKGTGAKVLSLTPEKEAARDGADADTPATAVKETAGR